jgi:glycosyltransferase involved in cell wall biosynthesis
MPPTVSLGLPVYNGEKYLAEAIRSILAQDYEDFEFIITDNASCDRTEEICRQFAAMDDRIRYVRNEKNLGAAPNFNLCFQLSSGKFFKWCAHDDMISANYIGECVRSLEENQDAALAFGVSKAIDSEGRVLEDRSDNMTLVDDADAFTRFRTAFDDSAHCDEIFGVQRVDFLKCTSLMESYWSADRTLLEEIALLGRFVFVPTTVFYNRHHQERSILIGSKIGRAKWQSGNNSKKYAVEYWSRSTHLVRVALRHRDVASLSKTLPFILRWALQPMRLIQYIVEAIGFVSPPAGAWLRRMGWRALNRKLW